MLGLLKQTHSHRHKSLIANLVLLSYDKMLFQNHNYFIICHIALIPDSCLLNMPRSLWKLSFVQVIPVGSLIPYRLIGGCLIHIPAAAIRPETFDPYLNSRVIFEVVGQLAFRFALPALRNKHERFAREPVEQDLTELTEGSQPKVLHRINDPEMGPLAPGDPLDQFVNGVAHHLEPAVDLFE